jgi:hypothetical protein
MIQGVVLATGIDPTIEVERHSGHGRFQYKSATRDETATLRFTDERVIVK